MLSLALHDSLPSEVLPIVLSLLEHGNAARRFGAVTSLGHLVRLHPELDLSLVVPALKKCLEDPALSGIADDVLDDIEHFSAMRR